MTCYLCHKDGHSFRDCPDKAKYTQKQLDEARSKAVVAHVKKQQQKKKKQEHPKA